MPILHTQQQGRIQTPDGSFLPANPADILQALGPCLQASVSLMQPMAQQLIAAGAMVPSPVSGNALIDTGATMTCIDDTIAQSLGLPIVDVTPMDSASHVSTLVNIYPISIDIAGLPISVNVPRALGVTTLDEQNIILLIGRDFLRHCALFYNGITGEITIAM